MTHAANQAFWTDARVTRLKELWADGNSCSEIAALMGAGSRCAISGKVHRLRGEGEIEQRVAGAEATVKQRRTYPAQRRRPRSKVPLPPEALAEKPQGEPKSKRVPFAKLTDHICRYIAEEQPPYTYCGHDVVPGYKWCKFHKELCLQKVSTVEANRRFANAAKWK